MGRKEYSEIPAVNTHYLSLRILFTGLHCQWIHFLFMNRQSATTPSVLTPKRKQIDIISTCRMQKLKLHHRSAIAYSRSTNSPSMSIVKKIGDTGSTLALHHCTCVLGSSFRGPQSTGAREADTPTSAWHPLWLSGTCSSHAWSRVKRSRSRRRNRMPAELRGLCRPRFPLTASCWTNFF